jgi:hypothetical protein
MAQLDAMVTAMTNVDLRIDDNSIYENTNTARHAKRKYPPGAK